MKFKEAIVKNEGFLHGTLFAKYLIWRSNIIRAQSWAKKMVSMKCTLINEEALHDSLKKYKLLSPTLCDVISSALLAQHHADTFILI
jgi:hypothetical protein